MHDSILLTEIGQHVIAPNMPAHPVVMHDDEVGDVVLLRQDDRVLRVE